MAKSLCRTKLPTALYFPFGPCSMSLAFNLFPISDCSVQFPVFKAFDETDAYGRNILGLLFTPKSVTSEEWHLCFKDFINGMSE